MMAQSVFRSPNRGARNVTESVWEVWTLRSKSSTVGLRVGRAEVIKVPKKGWSHTDQFTEIGIYPTGETMGLCADEDDADGRISRLEASSPSERFGSEMSDAPYRFVKRKRLVWESDSDE